MRRCLWKYGYFRNADDGPREMDPKTCSDNQLQIPLNERVTLTICRAIQSWEGFVFQQCHTNGKTSRIRLSMPQVIQLLWDCSRVDELLQARNSDMAREQRIHLGGNVFASVNKQYEGVSVRKWYKPDGQNKGLKPGQPGMFLRVDAWRKLYDILHKFVDYMPHHANDMPCSYRHENAQGFIDCSFCNPDHSYTMYSCWTVTSIT